MDSLIIINNRGRIKTKDNGGQATLAFVILIAGLIVEIVIAGSFISYFLGGSNFSQRLNARALAAAEAGIRDAAINIARNRDFVSGSSLSYSLSLDNDSAVISIVKTDDIVNNQYIYQITSTGSAINRQSRLVATITVDKITGLIQFKSLNEQVIQ